MRDGDAKRIYTGIPTYWDPDDKTKGGGPPDSWDFSMRVSGLPNYGVHVEPGDMLRSNAAYDTTLQSTYENMGIVVSLLVPEDENGNKQAPGVNPFTAPVDNSERCDSGGLTSVDADAVPERHARDARALQGERVPRRRRGRAGRPRHSGPLAGETSEIGIADFLYMPGDLSTANTLGVPKVPLGTDLRFTNADGAGDPAHDHELQVPVPRPDGGGVPAG